VVGVGYVVILKERITVLIAKVAKFVNIKNIKINAQLVIKNFIVSME
jgi:hypothetical protein